MALFTMFFIVWTAENMTSNIHEPDPNYIHELKTDQASQVLYTIL